MRPSLLGLPAVALAVIVVWVSRIAGMGQISALALATLVGVTAFFLLLVFASLTKYLRN